MASPHKRTVATNDVYTAILAIATFAVLTTAIFVYIKCVSDFDAAAFNIFSK